jgi:alpha-tubulin suppressor-like RCC1 family protein
MATRSNGSAWAWGSNGSAKLGDNTTTNRLSPVSVVGGFTDWCTVIAAIDHSVAIRNNGTTWSWGFGGSGRLGDGTTVQKSSPVSVVGGFTNWCQIGASYAHVVAVRTSGSAWAWGCNNCGQLGDGTTTNRSSPVSVVGGFTDWSQVGAGGRQTVAIRQEVKGF